MLIELPIVRSEGRRDGERCRGQIERVRAAAQMRAESGYSGAQTIMRQKEGKCKPTRNGTSRQEMRLAYRVGPQVVQEVLAIQNEHVAEVYNATNESECGRWDAMHNKNVD